MTRFFFNENKQNQNKKWFFFISFYFSAMWNKSNLHSSMHTVRPLLERQSKGTNMLCKTVISLLVYQAWYFMY